MADQLEAAFLAQLEEGEDLENLPPARFATMATRAGFLTEAPIDWTAEVVRSRLFPPGFLAELSVKLASGEIAPRNALAELSEREAEVTCRIGGIFLAEVLRRASDPLPPAPQP